jgi:7-cyano-7-deazaguanine synthase
MKRAVVLVSGGMDSAVTLARAREQGFACHALSVAYGQRHTSELAAAEQLAITLGAVAHKTVQVDLRLIRRGNRHRTDGGQAKGNCSGAYRISGS